MAAGHFNADTKIDLVVTYDYDGQSGAVQVFSGDGLGGFTSAGFSLSSFNAALAVDDLNGDGNLDAVAVAGESGSSGEAFLGNGAGGLFLASSFYSTIYWLPALAVAVGDFTGSTLDGRHGCVVGCDGLEQHA